MKNWNNFLNIELSINRLLPVLSGAVMSRHQPVLSVEMCSYVLRQPSLPI